MIINANGELVEKKGDYLMPNFIVGNDISTHQGIINYDTFTHNSNFVIIKATEGNGYTDSAFLLNQKEARRVGMCIGYYHFARPDLNNAADVEADWFLKVCGDLKVGEFLCLDYEANWNGNVVGWCNAFLAEVFKKTGIKPLIYLNQALAKGYDWSSVVNQGYALWIAAYTGSPDKNSFSTGNWSNAVMQQWTSTQQVPGVPANVDGNVFFGTTDQLKKFGVAPVTPPVVTPPVVVPPVVIPPTPPVVNSEPSPTPVTTNPTPSDSDVKLKTIHDTYWGKGFWWTKWSAIGRLLPR